LKLNSNQVERHDNNFNEIINDLSFDDNWITEKENHGSSLNFALIGVINSTPRRKNNKNDEEEFSNDVEIYSYGAGDDLKIQIDVNPKNSQ
jgi:hypothetical protein